MTSTDYLLPHLPFGGSEVTIVRWLKRAGDAVFAGEPLLVVVNDRVEVALPATCAGTFERALAVEGAAVAAGAAVAIIAANSAADLGDVLDPAQSTVRVSPVAQRIIHSEKIDITELHGTGVAGRIMKSDVLAALLIPSRDASLLSDHKGHADDSASPVTRHPSPVTYVFTTTDVDLERIAKLIAQHGPMFARRRLELSYSVNVALAAVAALSCYPLLNSYWAETMIVARRRVHLAIVPSGGASPCLVRDAQDLNLRGLARALSSTMSENTIEDRTFVIADLGNQLWGDPAALAGGVAALGLGAVRARPLVIDDGGVDRLVVRHTALLTLAYDARVLDQPYADAFLRDVKRRLE